MLNDSQRRRYARNIILPEIGDDGQQKLLDASILIIGVGGIGCPLLLYLAANGVGNIGIIDNDVVDLSNLQRQILFEMGDIGTSKVESAQQAIYDINPDCKITIYNSKLNEDNVEIISNYDIIADGSDNIDTRYLVNDNVYKYNKILVSAATQGFRGQIASFSSDTACYRCLYPNIDDRKISCKELGILGSVAGQVATIQATEIIKNIVGIGSNLLGKLMIIDSFNNTQKIITTNYNIGCSCRKNPQH